MTQFDPTHPLIKAMKGWDAIVSTPDCNHCEGTGIAPGDGTTDCGFCEAPTPKDNMPDTPLTPAIVIERGLERIRGHRGRGFYAVDANDTPIQSAEGDTLKGWTTYAEAGMTPDDCNVCSYGALYYGACGDPRADSMNDEQREVYFAADIIMRKALDNMFDDYGMGIASYTDDPEVTDEQVYALWENALVLAKAAEVPV